MPAPAAGDVREPRAPSVARPAAAAPNACAEIGKICELCGQRPTLGVLAMTTKPDDGRESFLDTALFSSSIAAWMCQQ